MTFNDNFSNHEFYEETLDSFHPIKWLENVGAFLNMNLEGKEPLLCHKGKKSVQTTVLSGV